MKPKLKLIALPADTVRDIYAADRALRESIDWSRVHISADRREPIDLPDTRKRGWLA